MDAEQSSQEGKRLIIISKYGASRTNWQALNLFADIEGLVICRPVQPQNLRTAEKSNRLFLLLELFLLIIIYTDKYFLKRNVFIVNYAYSHLNRKPNIGLKMKFTRKLTIVTCIYMFNNLFTGEDAF